MLSSFLFDVWLGKALEVEENVARHRHRRPRHLGPQVHHLNNTNKASNHRLVTGETAVLARMLRLRARLKHEWEGGRWGQICCSRQAQAKFSRLTSRVVWRFSPQQAGQISVPVRGSKDYSFSGLKKERCVWAVGPSCAQLLESCRLQFSSILRHLIG